jgi:hypothetical protein
MTNCKIQVCSLWIQDPLILLEVAPNRTFLTMGFAAFVDRINTAVNGSHVGRFFKMEERGTTMTRELNGAFSTFMSLGE